MEKPTYKYTKPYFKTFEAHWRTSPMNKNTSLNSIQVGRQARFQLRNKIFPNQLYFAVDIQNEQVL